MGVPFLSSKVSDHGPGLFKAKQALGTSSTHPEDKVTLQKDKTFSTHLLSKGTFLSGLSWWCSGKESTCQCRRHTRDVGSIPGSGRAAGGGSGNLLQYSCLGNPMDRGAWWATVHRVTKSQTRLSTEHLHFFPGWETQFKSKELTRKQSISPRIMCFLRTERFMKDERHPSTFGRD